MDLMTPTTESRASSAKPTIQPSAEARIAGYDWQALTGELDSHGCAVLPQLLSAEECRSVAALYPDESHFRSHVIIAHCKSTSGLDNSSMASGLPSLSQKGFQPAECDRPIF